MKTETRLHNINRHYDKVELETPRGSIVLQAGTRDHISVHRWDKDNMLVLSLNYGLPYVGAELINIKTMERVSECFFQESAVYCVHANLMKLTPCTIADYLSDYIYV